MSSSLCHQSTCSSALVSPCWWEDTNGLVVPRQTVNTGFNEDEAKLRVFIFAIALEVLADGNGLEQVSHRLKLCQNPRRDAAIPS